MSFLSIGDTFAAIIGINYGKRKFNGLKKTVEGSLGCFTSIMVFAFFFAGGVSPWVYTLGALAATLAELWEIPIDDNVKIPLISGLCMTLVNIII
jgi:dolichol kinase